MNVLCAGLIVCDILAKPITHSVFEQDNSRLNSVDVHSGGDAFNVAINTTKLGMHTTIAGCIGRDMFGNTLMEAAAKNGVNTAGISILEGTSTAVSLVLISPEGERNFAYHGGANDFFAPLHVSDALLSDADFVFLGSALGLPGLTGASLAQLSRRAKEHRATILLDVTGTPSCENYAFIKDSMQYIDIFMPSRYEACGFTGCNSLFDTANHFIADGCPTIVIKCGADGCYVATADRHEMIPAFKAKQVLDTTGAGDSFVSGFIYGLAAGKNPFEAAVSGLACGAFCVEAIGATANTPTKKMLDAFLTKNDASKFAKR